MINFLELGTALIWTQPWFCDVFAIHFVSNMNRFRLSRIRWNIAFIHRLTSSSLVCVTFTKWFEDELVNIKGCELWTHNFWFANLVICYFKLELSHLVLKLELSASNYIFRKSMKYRRGYNRLGCFWPMASFHIFCTRPRI